MSNAAYFWWHLKATENVMKLILLSCPHVAFRSSLSFVRYSQAAFVSACLFTELVQSLASKWRNMTKFCSVSGSSAVTCGAGGVVDWSHKSDELQRCLHSASAPWYNDMSTRDSPSCGLPLLCTELPSFSKDADFGFICFQYVEATYL